MRGGSEPTSEIWFTGTFGECGETSKQATLTPTEIADAEDLLANPNNYSVQLNDVKLPYFEVDSGGGYNWMDTNPIPDTPIKIVGYASSIGWAAFVSDCDFPNDAKVYVTKK